MGVQFDSAEQFCAVIDRVMTLMSEDAQIGPKLRDADVPQRFEFDDMGLVVNARAALDGEPGNLHWEWTDDVDWQPKVRLTMSSEVANRYFQGKENVPVAIARGRITAGGEVDAALALIPITKPVYGLYRSMLEADYPQLVV